MEVLPKNEWVVEADFECDSAIEATRKLLSLAEKPTALFCFNDMMALAAISTVRQMGLDVPKDISIIGYDNIDFAAFFSPPLTTIHQPKKRLGKMAIKLLIDRIQNKENKKQIVNITPELVIRESVRSI